jgi:hypothetical protein
MGVKKATRAKTRKTATKAAKAAVADSPIADSPIAESAPANSAEPGTRMGLPKMIGVGMAVVAIAMVAGVVMFAGRESTEPEDVTTAAAQPESPAVQPTPVKPVRAIAGVPGKNRKAPLKPRAAEANGASAAPKSASELPDAVMLEGCLEQNGEAFRLKNTTGEDAPKSRSWKSGFLKKGPRPVDIVDWNNRLKNHVGERIAVSGMFVDGEMRVRTLRRVAASCN